jgi:hypothetical protein
MMSDPIPQGRLQQLLFPFMRLHPQRYRKFKQVLARPSIPGETIVSVTSTAVETINTASAGDFVVENMTEAREQYLVSHEKFLQRYVLAGIRDGGWSLYDPLGEIVGLEIEAQVLALLDCPSPFSIIAPWNAEQIAEFGDFLVTPPDFSEIYRIARDEFIQTYRVEIPG